MGGILLDTKRNSRGGGGVMTAKRPYIIVKSDGRNWSGKEFSDAPAKVYSTFSSVVNDLQAYWIEEKEECAITLLFLDDEQLNNALNNGEVRW